MKKTLYFLFTLALAACTTSQKEEPVEKHYDARSNVINVKSLIHEIEMEEPIISTWASPIIMNNYLVIGDVKSPGKLIHIFDKNNFKYLASTGDFGQGPGELSNMGSLLPVEQYNSFYVLDAGSQNIYNFNIDSILCDPNYLPSVKGKMNGRRFPVQIHYVNDTLSYAMVWDILNAGDYRPRAACYNLLTGESRFMEYLGHPEVERKRVSLAVSPENNLYAEAYWYHDLITLHSLDGKLKHILYGAKWNNQRSNRNEYFGVPCFCNDKLIATYVGGPRFVKKNGQEKVVYPTQLAIFDLKGNYLATLETNYAIHNLCVDEENDRIIFSFDDEIQFGYLDLKSVPGLGKK